MAWSVLTTITGVVSGDVSWSPDGNHVAISGFGFVTIIEAGTWDTIAVITVGDNPGVEWSPDGSMIAVPNGGDENFMIIETVGWTITDTVLTNQGGRPAPFQPGGAGWSPDGSLLAICGNGSAIGGKAVRVFETAGWTIAHEAGATLLSAHQAIFSSDGSQLVVSSFSDDSVSVVETTGYTITDTVSPLDGAFGEDWADAGAGAFVAVCVSNDDSVAIIETTGWTVTQTIPAPAGPGNNALDLIILPNETQILVTNPGDDSVFVIDTSDWSIAQIISVGAAPDGIDASPDSQLVAVANTEDASVTILFQPQPPTFHRIYGIQIQLDNNGVEGPVTLTTSDAQAAPTS